MIDEITQPISPITPLPGLLAENRPAAVNVLVEEELPQNSIEMEALRGQLNTFRSQVNATADEVQANADIASEAATIAVASANYKSDWVAGYNTVGYMIGDGVTYSDGYNYVSKIDNNLTEPTTLTNTAEWNFIEAVNPNNYYLKTEIDKKITINDFTNKTTPIDTDNIAIQEVGGLFKKLTWANLKATLKTYFDTLYPAISGYPAFSASKLGQAFTANVLTKLACDVEAYDNTNEYDNVTNFRFQPTKAGKYNVFVQMQSASGNFGASINIYKNGSPFRRLQGTVASTVADVMSGCAIVELNGTTDYIEAYGSWSSNNTANSIFEAYYITGV